MSSIEITGKNIETAMQTAAAELGVSIEDIQYEVIEESGKGFLGLGPARVKIRAWTSKISAPEAEMEPEPVFTEAPTSYTNEVAQPATGGNMGEDLIDILNQVLTAMNLDAHPKLRESSDEEIQVNLTGQDVAILIGKQGQTLDALQYLTALALNKKHNTRIRVILDAEGYRDRHRAMIESKAREFVEKVKDSGQEAVLDPLPARDRRIIHTYLADDPDVTTYSEGEGDGRRLVITPRK